MMEQKLDEDLDREKIYLIGSLEKKLQYFNDYHTFNKEKKEKFVDEVSDLLNKLKDHKIEKEEKKIIERLVFILKFLRKFLR